MRGILQRQDATHRYFTPPKSPSHFATIARFPLVNARDTVSLPLYECQQPFVTVEMKRADRDEDATFAQREEEPMRHQQ